MKKPLIFNTYSLGGPGNKIVPLSDDDDDDDDFPQFQIVSASTKKNGKQFRGKVIAKDNKLVWSTEAYPAKALVRKAINIAMNVFIAIDKTLSKKKNK